MRKLVSSIIVSMTLASGAAYGSDWILVTNTNDAAFYSLAGSGKIVTVNNTQYVQVTTEIRVKDGQVLLSLKRISVANCKNGYGKLNDHDLSGNYNYSNDFVFGGSSAASVLARSYCNGMLQSQTRAM